MSMKTFLAALALGVVAVGLAVPGIADEEKGSTYHFGTHTKHTNITFVSEADIENIYGSSTDVSGSARLDFEKGDGEVSLSIPVKSLRTGIELRDEHLRGEKWLHEEKHPDITFTSDEVASTDEKKLKWTAKGKLTIKGVTKDLTADVRVRRIPEKLRKKLGEGEWVKVTTTFEVDVTEFGVEIPEGVGPKVSKTWAIKFDCFATTVKPEAE